MRLASREPVKPPSASGRIDETLLGLGFVNCRNLDVGHVDSCGEIALTPSATHGVTHGAVDEVKRDEDGAGKINISGL